MNMEPKRVLLKEISGGLKTSTDYMNIISDNYPIREFM